VLKNEKLILKEKNHTVDRFGSAVYRGVVLRRVARDQPSLQ
jgi:hypothetical protein